MRSALHDSYGDPASVLRVADRSVPEPAQGEIRIKTILAPIHNHDLWTVRGQYGYKPALPAIGGSEGFGVVDALGEGVEGFKIGQRVAAASVHGTWAEYFVAPARMVIPIPDTFAEEVAAQLVAMPLSALMLLEFLQVKEGDWIVQNAANGAVGKALAILARARGIHTVSLVRRDSGVSELKVMGIENAVSTAGIGWQEQVRSIVGNGNIRAAVDSVGGNSSGELSSLLSAGGTLVSFGSMSGEPMQIPTGDLIYKEATVKGFWGSKVSQSMTIDEKRRLVQELLERTAGGEMKMPVEAIFDLADVPLAVKASVQAGRKGKILLRP